MTKHRAFLLVSRNGSVGETVEQPVEARQTGIRAPPGPLLDAGSFVYRKDTALSTRRGGFDSHTSYSHPRPGRGKAWLIRKLGELEIAGSNPAALTFGRGKPIEDRDDELDQTHTPARGVPPGVVV